MTRSLFFGRAALLALSLGLATRAARADSPGPNAVPVCVLTLWTEDADDQADALTRALRSRVQQTPGWSLQDASQSFETLSIALKCPPKPDAACLLRIGDQLKAAHYVWGTMERKKGTQGEVSATLHMWARGKLGVEAHGVFADTLKDPGDEVLQQIAGELFGQLAGIVPQPPGKPAPLAPEGAPVVPAAPPERGTQPGAGAMGTDLPPTESGGKFSARTALAYSTLALGLGFVVGAVVEAANWVSDSNASTQDRQSISASVTDVCAEPANPAALDACNKSSDAQKASALGWVFGGVGVGLVATGVWLIVTDHPARAHAADEARVVAKPHLDIEPSLGPRSGALRLRVTF